MLIQVNTDNHIEGREKLVAWVEDEVTGSLDRFQPQLTRVEVYLSDQNGPKSSADEFKCTVEARLAGIDPIAVSKQADSLRAALEASLDALTLTLDNRLAKLQSAKGRTSFGGDQTI